MLTVRALFRPLSRARSCSSRADSQWGSARSPHPVWVGRGGGGGGAAWGAMTPWCRPRAGDDDNGEAVAELESGTASCAKIGAMDDVVGAPSVDGVVRCPETGAALRRPSTLITPSDAEPASWPSMLSAGGNVAACDAGGCEEEEGPGCRWGASSCMASTAALAASMTAVARANLQGSQTCQDDPAQNGRSARFDSRQGRGGVLPSHVGRLRAAHGRLHLQQRVGGGVHDGDGLGGAANNLGGGGEGKAEGGGRL